MYRLRLSKTMHTENDQKRAIITIIFKCMLYQFVHLTITLQIPKFGCLIKTQIILLTLFSNILTYYIQINLSNQKKKKQVKNSGKMMAAVET